jgi:hypothetical protein
MFLYRKTLTIPSRFVLYGERHSGTKFFEHIIRSTYGLTVNHEYGQKHFFGFANHKQISVDEKTIFFCIVRNPYHWIAAMNSLPHHVSHSLLPLYDHLFDEWHSISQYWTVWDHKPVTIINNEIMEDRHLSLNRRYKNILELRNVKNNYLLNILPIYAHNLVIISYEELMANHNTILNNIGKSFLLSVNNIDKIKIVPSNNRFLPEDLIQQINPYLDWQTENLLGYTKL